MAASLAGVEVGGRLVEDDQPGVGEERPRDREPLALAAAEADARPRRPACRSRAGGPSMNASAPASRAAAATSSSVASGRARRMLSATVPWNRCGRCGTQARRARQAEGRCSASGTSADVDRSRVGLDEPEQQARDRSSCRPPSRRPARRRRRAGIDEVEPVEGRVRPARVGEPRRPRTGCRRVGRDRRAGRDRRDGRPRAAIGTGSSRIAKRPLGDRLAGRPEW